MASKNLTVRAIESLKPGEVRQEIADAAARGLFLQLQPSGSKSWAFRFRIDGRSRKLGLGRYPEIDLGTARQRAREASIKVAAGLDPCERARETVSDLATLWDERHISRAVKPQPAAEIRRILRREVLPAWGKRPVSSISRRDVRQLVEAIAERGAPVMANWTFGVISALLNYGVAQDVLTASPTTGLKKSAEQSRDRTLTDSELRAIWRATETMGYPFGPLARILVLTGCRRSEAARMAWSELDLTAKSWTLTGARTKNGVAHVIPLSDLAIAILQTIPKAKNCGFVFSVDGRNPIKGFVRPKAQLEQLAGITERWTLHDLRRTFATGCAKLGVTRDVVEKLLNHISGLHGGIAGIYKCYDFANEKREAIEKWSRHVDGIIKQ